MNDSLATTAEVFEEFAQHATDERLFGFCLIMLLRRLLDHFRHCIQKEKAADILLNCDLQCLKVSQARPFPMIAYTGY